MSLKKEMLAQARLELLQAEAQVKVMQALVDLLARTKGNGAAAKPGHGKGKARAARGAMEAAVIAGLEAHGGKRVSGSVVRDYVDVHRPARLENKSVGNGSMSRRVSSELSRLRNLGLVKKGKRAGRSATWSLT